MQQLKAMWPALRWVIAAVVIGGGLWLLLEMLLQAPKPGDVPYDVPFSLWYGNWRAVLIATAVFTLFLLGFARPRRQGEWRSAGLYVAFLISLFTEMYGVPLTIYLVAPVVEFPSWAFGLNESHLWAFAFDRLGLMPLNVAVYLVMLVSMALIIAGVGLLAVGWATIHREREDLVTTGIYRIIRHPQYFGLILIVIAFNIQWPTILTLLMAPMLIVTYVRQARREDKELGGQFGGAYVRYASRVPAFIPCRRAHSELTEQGEAREIGFPSPPREGAGKAE